MLRFVASSATVLAALLLSVVAQAQQKPSAVIGKFRGLGAHAARKVVVSSTRRTIAAIPENRVNATAKRLKVRAQTQPGLLTVAKELQVQLVITGEVQGRGKRSRTVIRVLTVDGTELGMREVESPSVCIKKEVDKPCVVQFTKKTQKAIAEAATQVVAQALARAPVAAPPPPATSTTTVAPSEEAPQTEYEEVEVPLAEDADAEPTPPPLEVAPEEQVAEPEEEAELAPAPVRVESDRDWLKPPIFAGYVGFGGRSRKADIHTRDGDTRTYDSQFFPEVTLRLEVHPLARKQRALRGIYLQVEGSLGVGLTTKYETENVDTKAYRIGGLAGYMYDFAKGRVGVGANFGFVYDAFILGSNNTITTSRYASLRPGIVMRFAILRALLQTQLDAGFRIPLGAGALDPAFGNFSSKVGSFDVGLSIFGALPIGLTYAVRGGITRYAYSFSGVGTLVDGKDGTDTSWNFTGQIGWQIP